MAKKHETAPAAPAAVSRTLKLSRPITDGNGMTWTEVHVALPELGHYMLAERETTSEVSEAARLFAELTNVPEDAIHKMKTGDARALRRMIDAANETSFASDIRVDGDRHTITLEHPIVIDGQPHIGALTLREPDLAAGIAIEKFNKPREQLAATIAVLSGLTIPVTRRLKMTDVRRIETWLAPFVADTLSMEADGAT